MTDKEIQEIEERLEIVTGKPYALINCLDTLAKATNHLLADHNCDVHGHEEYAHARHAAAGQVVVGRMILADIRTLLDQIKALREKVAGQEKREKRIRKGIGDIYGDIMREIAANPEHKNVGKRGCADKIFNLCYELAQP